MYLDKLCLDLKSSFNMRRKDVSDKSCKEDVDVDFIVDFTRFYNRLHKMKQRL